MRRKSYEEIENIINSTNYEGAKNYYRNLRDRLSKFIENIAGPETAALFMDTLSEQIASRLDIRLNNSNLINDIAFKKLPEKIEELLYSQLEGKEGNSIIESAKSEYLQYKNANSEEAKKAIRMSLQRVVDELNSTKKIMTYLKRLNKLNKNAIDLKDIENQLPAIQRKIIKNFFETGQVSNKGGSNLSLAIIAGYYEEAVVADAIYNYLIELGINSKDFTAKQIGSVKLDGKDTSYDILFGAIFGKTESQIALDLQKMNGIINIDNSLNTFGIQVKRASLPTRFIFKKDFEEGKGENARFLKKYSGTSAAFKIGNRENLIQSYKERFGKDIQYHWSDGITFLGETENTKEALGPGNVMWVTGNEPMWTDDFIEIFTNNKLRLNFDFLLDKNYNGSLAYKANNLIVLAYHNANLKSAIINGTNKS